MMEFYLEKANRGRKDDNGGAENGEGSNNDAPQNYENPRRKEDIRQHLSSKGSEDFHLREIEKAYKSAMDRAVEGDRCMMEFYLEKAKLHSSNVVVLGDKDGILLQKIYETQEKEIRYRLLLQNKEEMFQSQQMEKSYKMALKYAKEGDRQLMDLYLEKAGKHCVSMIEISDNDDVAVKLQKLKRHEEKESEIRQKLLQGNEIISFHLRVMKNAYQSAKDKANEGDKSMMEYYLEKAQKHSILANQSDFDEVQSIFNNNNGSKQQQQQQRLQKEEEEENQNNEKITINKELNVDQLLENRLQEAETKGEVIHLK